MKTETTDPKLFAPLVDQINSMGEEDLINLNNAYCREINSEDEIYENDDEFFEIFFSNKVIDAVRAVSFGDYTYSHKYLKFNGYANLETFNHFSIKDLCELPEVIAEYAIENQAEFEDLLDFDVED